MVGRLMVGKVARVERGVEGSYLHGACVGKRLEKGWECVGEVMR